jgi:hypothetical protein
VERRYWLGRMQSSVVRAEGATSDVARLIHYDLAGRYSVNAANAPCFSLECSDVPPTDASSIANGKVSPRSLPSKERT